MEKHKGFYVPIKNLQLQEGEVQQGNVVAWSGYVAVIKTDSATETEKERNFVFKAGASLA